MKTMVELSHAFLQEAMHKQAIVLDGTYGNGSDTRFFLDQPVKKIYAFEIQPELKPKTIPSSLVWILDSHAHLDRYIQESLDAAIFNFGYCPGLDPSITTQASSSVEAIQKTMQRLKPKGRLSLVLYAHENSLLEQQEIERFLKTLDPRQYGIQKITNYLKKDSPYLFLIEKRKSAKKS
ncbi:tRNA (mnm(5)s(2)U34)-methyltransferase [Dubosiella newyorkensis]|uniref:tRNA (mnm(5)s(2)U34)-methyltransferase n=1 Tax=Dubosiella newyorkensis TaxID=1862672 RepID=UPI00258A2A84|nr:class I SAM-dependent methyltransferase [Dubosiella newyorkensis]